MTANFHRQRDKGLEIAINPNDLRIRSRCQILENRTASEVEATFQTQPSNTRLLTNRVIHHNQSWSLEFTWRVYGAFARLLSCGYWKCKVYFELMGGGETNYSPEVVVQDLGRSGQTYRSRIEIQPRSLKPGVYRVVCCLQYCFEDNSPGPIAGFNDKGLVKIYESPMAYEPYPSENGLADVEVG